MAFRTDNFQPSGSLSIFIELNIRTTPCHIRGNRNCPMLPGLCHNFRLQLMELGIQNLMLDPLAFQHPAEQLRSLNCNGAHQHRLSLFIGFLNFLDHCPELFLLRLIYGILQILTDHWLVGRNLNHVHTINIAEFLFLCQSRTGHAGFFGIFIEEILEGNRSQRLALTFHLHMLLGLNCLVQAIGITAPRHNTPRKFIYNQHLLILHHIILVTEH